MPANNSAHRPVGLAAPAWRTVGALVFCVASLGGSALGCGSWALRQGPNAALESYARALEEGRVEEAYRLLSDDARRTMSLEAFRRAVKDHPDDAVEVARALLRPTTDPLILATVTVGGEELVLVYEGDRWRIDAAAVDLYSQATPRQAVEGLLRAYDKKRYDVILRYVPDAEREGAGTLGEIDPGAGSALTADMLKASWEGPEKEQIENTMRAIKAALGTSPIEETGDSAAMAYGAGGVVALVREKGLWKVRDL